MDIKIRGISVAHSISDGTIKAIGTFMVLIVRTQCPLHVPVIKKGEEGALPPIGTTKVP